MRWKSLAVVASTAVLVGCGGFKYAIDNYTGIKPVTFNSPTTKTGYLIYDKPAEDRLMITSSLGSAAGQGIVQGLTFGAVSALPPEVIFEKAAIEYLAGKGRTCTAKRTFLIVQPQFEVQYECRG